MNHAGPPSNAIRETWESVEKMSLNLAGAIEQDSHTSGEQFDLMLVVPRGSYYPVNIISRIFGFSSTELIHACIGSYNIGATKRNEELAHGQMPAKEQVKGKNILIIEEVCETGHTLRFLSNWLQDAGAGLVRTGVLHYKPERSETDFVPDWFVTKTDKWVVYPWEIYEHSGKPSYVHKRAG